MTNLTKAFLGGIKHIETVNLTHPATGEEVTVQVRPLSDGESRDIQALLAGGLELAGDPSAVGKGSEPIVKGDLAKITECQHLAARKAVAKAIVSDEKWTEEDIANLWPPAWVNSVAAVIYRISGIKVSVKDGGKDEDQFRDVRGGTGGAAAH